jgi:hypothetical protein
MKQEEEEKKFSAGPVSPSAGYTCERYEGKFNTKDELRKHTCSGPEVGYIPVRYNAVVS